MADGKGDRWWINGSHPDFLGRERQGRMRRLDGQVIGRGWEPLWAEQKEYQLAKGIARVSSTLWIQTDERVAYSSQSSRKTIWQASATLSTLSSLEGIMAKANEPTSMVPFYSPATTPSRKSTRRFARSALDLAKRLCCRTTMRSNHSNSPKCEEISRWAAPNRKYGSSLRWSGRFWQRI